MLPRMRTIAETMKLVREQDPDTGLTETALRRMVIAGELPAVVKVGTKYLVNVDSLIQYLNGNTPKTYPAGGSPTITRVRP